MYGKTLRMRRLFPSERRRLFSVPLDHSVSMGPIEGLEDAPRLVSDLQDAGLDMVVVTKGAVGPLVPILRPSTLLGIHVSASTSLSPNSDHKVLVGTAEEAIALGADLLSIQVNFGVSQEGDMLRSLGVAADQCRSAGLPLMCMTYVKKAGGGSPEELRHACRAAADTGADIVKTSYPGSLAEFTRLVRTTPVPLLLGGGARLDRDEELVRLVRETVEAKAAGICIGRNLFQRSPVGPLAGQIAAILHGVP